MLRLFDRLMGNETKVMTELNYHGNRIGENNFGKFSGSTEFKPCYSTNDFRGVYESIKGIIEVQSSIGLDAAIEIKLRGKLKGNDVTQEFKDLNSYRQFLENHSLIEPTIRPNIRLVS